MRSIAKVISENTNNKYDAVISKSNDKDYINRLATKYWFIDKDVQKNGTFYKLEGYLYPNTYVFKNKNVTIEMSKEVESLNLSISAGVILYKLFTTRA